MFYKAKEAFFREIGASYEGYPLGHLFLENSYTPGEFISYLKRWIVTSDDIMKIFKEMDGYSGQLTPELNLYSNSVKDGTFFEIYSQLTEFICEIFGKTQVSYAGAKEVFCEEFIPFFLDSGSRVILIIRDPRDVLTSINFGKGEKYVGKGLPTLYILRNWRKSVAFALAYKDNPRFFFIKYEDLVRDIKFQLQRITDFLCLEHFSEEQLRERILEQHGSVWKSNSSFEPSESINSSSIGIFRQKLSKEIVKYVESICYPEIVAMGYEPAVCLSWASEKTIKKFKEPFEMGLKSIPADYSMQAENIQNEIKRLRFLLGTAVLKEKRLWFLFPIVYDLLKCAVSQKRV